ncbi:MAG: hypothetical protein Fur0014_01020 [Rubrivivax sp.]
MSAPACLFVEMHITDPAQYQPSMAAVPAVARASGGEQSLAFHADSDHVSKVEPLRQGATEYFNMVLVEGVAAPV